jgi:hypothetical protein
MEKKDDLEKHRQIPRDRTGFCTLVGNFWFFSQDS